MKTTTQKAEGLQGTRILAQGDKLFLQSLKQFLGNAKENSNPEFATAARKWERVLAYRIRVALRNCKGGRGRNSESRSQESEVKVAALPHPQPLSHPMSEGGVGFSPAWKEAA